ncbi:MAG: CsgG/HfaB family protein [Gemmatimonadaceae bacterium]
MLRSSQARRSAILALASFATVTPLAAQPAADRRPTLAVMYLTNGALVDHDTYAPLSKGMAEMLISELAQNSGVRVVERDRIQSLIEEQNLQNSDRVDKETAVRMGKAVGARHMLMGTFVIDPKQNMRIDVRAVNTETTTIDHVETVTGKADRLLELVIQLGQKLNAGLKLPAVRTASSSTPASKNPNQFKAIMAMSRALEAEDRNNIAEAKTLYATAVSLNPEYETAKVRLATISRATP